MRQAFDHQLSLACGDDDNAFAASELVRAPYLQRTETDSTNVLFTATSIESYRVDVTLPDGSSVGSYDSIHDIEATPHDAHQHHVELSGLEADTIYCYSLHGAGDTLMAPRAGFRTAPLSDSEAPVRFVAFGDSGSGGDGQYAVFDQMRQTAFDLVVVTGDVAYDSGTLDQYERTFFSVYEPMLVSVPTFPVLGNHDTYTDNGAPFREVFDLPANGGPEGIERWYSFDWGPVHFVAIDTELPSEAQAQWVEADLQANGQPWTVVFTHKSPYSSGSHGSYLGFRETFSPILEKYGVKLVLAGHDHHYERTKPIGGITYVITGGGGRGTRSAGVSSFTAFSEDVLHFVHVTIAGDTLTLRAVDATGQEFDHVEIAGGEAS